MKKQEKAAKPYETAIGQNGIAYVKKESTGAVLHLVKGNSKTGPCINYNIAIEYTCDHRCECYKKGMCYACQGCYRFASNQNKYTENYNFYKACGSPSVFAKAIIEAIDNDGELSKLDKFRWFTCGDIADYSFFVAMVEIAKAKPEISFWTYTKKYSIVNKWISNNGSIPENLVVIFSHWMNDDGSFFPMDNPYMLPTSEFIPLGKENVIQVTHLCPCSDPSVKATCATCDHPCYTLKAGESMGLQEHSTSRTKARDKAIKAAKAKLK